MRHKTDYQLTTLRIKRFKAIRDTGLLRLTPFTMLIGNNGSGKSSLIESLMTIRRLAVDGLDAAMQQWKGFEHVANKMGIQEKKRRSTSYPPIEFDLGGKILGRHRFHYKTAITGTAGFNELRFVRDRLTVQGRVKAFREKDADCMLGKILRSDDENMNGEASFHPDKSVLVADSPFRSYLENWQFLTLQPNQMTEPYPVKRTAGRVELLPDGRNSAQYLCDIRDRNAAVFDSIVESMASVLPYASDIQPVIASEIERAAYLQMTEGSYKIPGWLLSTGTLRILAILAVLRDPSPPRLVCIEELENGLDPRTLHMVLNEIRDAVQEGRTQVIATTHSPYLLDLLPLQTIVVVERDENGNPVFRRPVDDPETREWAQTFAPGRL